MTPRHHGAGHGNYPSERSGFHEVSPRSIRAAKVGRCVLCVDREAKCWACAAAVDELAKYKAWTEGK